MFARDTVFILPSRPSAPRMCPVSSHWQISQKLQRAMVTHETPSQVHAGKCMQQNRETVFLWSDEPTDSPALYGCRPSLPFLPAYRLPIIVQNTAIVGCIAGHHRTSSCGERRSCPLSAWQLHEKQFDRTLSREASLTVPFQPSQFFIRCVFFLFNQRSKQARNQRGRPLYHHPKMPKDTF